MSIVYKIVLVFLAPGVGVSGYPLGQIAIGLPLVLVALFQFSRGCIAAGHYSTMDGRTACYCDRLAPALRVRVESRRHQTDPGFLPPCMVWVGSHGAQQMGAGRRAGGDRVGCISHQFRNDLRVGNARWRVRTSQERLGSGSGRLKDCHRHAGSGRNHGLVDFAPCWRLECHRRLSLPIKFLYLAVPAILDCLPRTLCLIGRAGANRRSGRCAAGIRNAQDQYDYVLVFGGDSAARLRYAQTPTRYDSRSLRCFERVCHTNRTKDCVQFG